MVYVDEKRCSGCGACVDVCPAGAIAIRDGVANIDQELCTECEACAAACVEGAILTVTEPAALVQSRRQPTPVVPERTPVSLAARAAPAVGSALFFLGREIVPRVASYLLDALDRKMSTPSTSSSDQDTLTSPRSARGGGRRARRRRGRR